MAGYHKVELAKGIYPVGVVDWPMRDFHGFTTPRGVTYNSYLIVDEKIALIDTVKAPFAGELMSRVADIVDPSAVDYIVVNHVEPDHGSALPIIAAQMPKAKVIITEQGRVEALKYFGGTYETQTVKEGDSLCLGRNTLQFIPIPMLHWPDSMATYLQEEQILFSNDAFGQHFSSNYRFDDENDLHDVMYEASKYYANILMPFNRLVTKAVEKLSPVPIRMIAPSHGVIWRSHVKEILEQYARWGCGLADSSVVIVYDTMWGSTETMARKILEGLTAGGCRTKIYRMTASDRSEVVREVLEAKGLLLGSSTINNGILPNMGALLYYLKGLKPQNKIGAGFGAYGWSGGAQMELENGLKAATVNVDMKGPTVKWAPSQEELENCYEFGLAFAKRIVETKNG